MSTLNYTHRLHFHCSITTYVISNCLTYSQINNSRQANLVAKNLKKLIKYLVKLQWSHWSSRRCCQLLLAIIAAKSDSTKSTLWHFTQNQCLMSKKEVGLPSLPFSLPSPPPLPDAESTIGGGQPSPSFSFPSPFPSFPLEVGLLYYSKGAWWRAVSCHSGVWGGAPVEINFGAF